MTRHLSFHCFSFADASVSAQAARVHHTRHEKFAPNRRGRSKSSPVSDSELFASFYSMDQESQIISGMSGIKDSFGPF